MGGRGPGCGLRGPAARLRVPGDAWAAWGPGLWWPATTGRHVAAGSNAMRIQLTALDRNSRVVGMAGRPVRLLRHNRRGQVRSWVPQLSARYTDGTALLADCPSHPDASGERTLHAAETVTQACAHHGWTCQRLTPLHDIPPPT
ncbi:TnsA-like heteromeric transposase endonuclease subunit [Streptomyces sp. NPDC001634]|uniref:TnsA-like heteromeric transposase endonuclease subunit n=1 Tax=Streptomyces sp. NPDC001634 TaxID=3154390 RepID=UPI00331EBE82